ncbi:MAG: hypothetical protein CM15mV42_1240 [uncultured marine virus]|nr:MAG: hypothetical protein CM15mV42_1240 [uncultured marine virus]
MDIIKVIFDNIKLVMLAAIVILIMLLLRQCDSTKKAKGEITRIVNNNLALTDTLEHYIDENGLLNGEVRGLNLKVSELADSVKIEKNKPPVTIVEYVTEVRDSIVFKPIIDTVVIEPDGTYNHTVKYIDSISYGKSRRFVNFNMPVFTKDSLLYTGTANLSLRQNIWLEASILQDIKSKEVFVNLKTDYPGVSFNNATGILVERNEEFKVFARQQRKQFGLGLQLGIGFSDQIRPYVGVGIHYSPRFLQW